MTSIPPEQKELHTSHVELLPSSHHVRIDLEELLNEYHQVIKQTRWYGRTATWHCLPLRSLGGEMGPASINPPYLKHIVDPILYQNLTHLGPETQKVIESVGGDRVLLARYMKLKVGGSIGTHVDKYPACVVRYHFTGIS